MMVPPKHLKWSFLVGKPMVVGYQHFRKPPYIEISSTHQIFCTKSTIPATYRGKDFADRWPSGNMRAEYTPGQYHIYLKENRCNRFSEVETTGRWFGSLPLEVRDELKEGWAIWLMPFGGGGGGTNSKMARISGSDSFFWGGSYLPKGL